MALWVAATGYPLLRFTNLQGSGKVQTLSGHKQIAMSHSHPPIFNMSSQAKPFTKEQEEELRESLRRCSNQTIEAAIAYRREGDQSGLSTVVLGIIERYLEPEFSDKLDPNNPDLHIQEDLGIDSLTMVEVVMLVEEAIDITIDNNELRNLSTIGDIHQFIATKVSQSD